MWPTTVQSLPSCESKQKFCSECGNHVLGPSQRAAKGACQGYPKPGKPNECQAPKSSYFKYPAYRIQDKQVSELKNKVSETIGSIQCPWCHFIGNSYNVINHLQTIHVNPLVQAVTLKQLLCYNDLGTFMSVIHTKDIKYLRALACMKILSICSLCKRLLRGSVTYVCPNYHLACEDCCTRLCRACNTCVVWNRKTELNDILLQCEWPDCPMVVTIFNYLWHKSKCEYRQYRCPDKNCEFVGDLSSLQDHWHLIPFKMGSLISIASDSIHYWLVPHRDILLITRRGTVGAHNVLTVTNVDVVSDFCNNLVLTLYDTYFSEVTSSVWDYKVTEPVKHMSISKKHCLIGVSI